MALAAAVEHAPFSNEARDIAGQMYTTVQEVIKATCLRFWLRHGGDLEELESEANRAWLLGHKHHMDGQGHADYATEIKRWVWYELFDRHRTRTGHRRAVKELRVSPENLAFVGTSGVDPAEWINELSADAKLVLKLVLRTPKHLAEAAQRRGGEPRNLRNVVRAYLADLGWAAKEINNAFDEIRQAL